MFGMNSIFDFSEVIREMYLVNRDTNQYKRVEIKESRDSFPYKVVDENGVNERASSSISNSYKDVSEAEKRFNTLVQECLSKGYVQVSI